jgi:predicted SnoaL-like aldol condensation-catalyzing enzyme
MTDPTLTPSTADDPAPRAAAEPSAPARRAVLRTAVTGAAAAGLAVALPTLLASPAAAQTGATPRGAGGPVSKRIFLRAFQEIFLAHDLSKVDRYYAPDFVQHNPEAPAGRAGVVWYFSQLFASFPDWTGEIEHLYAEGDRVFSIVNWHGTFTGAPLFGFPANGKVLSQRTADVARIERGLIAEHWDVVDGAEFWAGVSGTP